MPVSSPRRPVVSVLVPAAFLFCVAVLVSAVLPLAAQPPAPGTPAAAQEARAMALAAAMKAGDADALFRVLEENLTPETWASRERDEWAGLATRMTGDFAGVDVAGVEAQEPNKLQLHFAESSRLPAAVMDIEFEATEPFPIITIGIRVGGPVEAGAADYPPFELPSDADRKTVFRMLDEYLAGLAADDLFSGVVMIAVDGEPVYSHVEGLASIRYNAPNTLKTRFDLGSINKDFTKMAIGQLLEQGKLQLADTIAELLPDYPNREVAEKITVEQLLSHTSGLGDMFTEKFEARSRGQMRDLVDYLPLFVDEPLQFEPGEGQSYSNAGFIVLGLIVEAITGVPYQDYVEEHVFKLAGMTGAGFFARDGIEPNVADGYTRWYTDDPNAPWRSNVYMLPARGNSAGSAQATAADLVAYDNALREHRLLSPGWTRWFFGAPVPALGATDGDDSRIMVGIGIAGGAPGVTAALESDGRVAMVILGNIDEPMAEVIVQRIWGAIGQAIR